MELQDYTNRKDREIETREEFQRPDSWKPASLLPEFKKVPGWAYRWIRTSLLNDADNLKVYYDLMFKDEK